MASSRVMASTSTSARAEQSPLYPVGHLAELGGERRGGSLGSMNMEELLRNFYADTPAGAAPAGEIAPCDAVAVGGEKGCGGGGADRGGGGGGRDEGYSAAPRPKTTEEVWREISRERKVEEEAEPVYKEEGFGAMTLEAYLARAGAVTEEEVRAAPAVAVQSQMEAPVLGFVVDPAMADRYAQQQQPLVHVGGSIAGFGSGKNGGRGGKGKRRAMEGPEDKASQQKQRRMIKNRESAARSRERKQVYE